jgi:hypothetical protein
MVSWEAFFSMVCSKLPIEMYGVAGVVVEIYAGVAPAAV